MLKVFYNPRMVAAPQMGSPSPHKPQLLMELWRQRFPSELNFVEDFRPCDPFDLYTAHEQEYVRDVARGLRKNGFGTYDLDLAHTLFWTTGSIKAAAEWSVVSGEASCSPTSGFHHAGYDFGGGFCTFNGLMVAAQWVHELYRDAQVGILDADMHFGNGTDDILQRLPHRNWIRHWSLGENWFAKQHAPAFLEEWSGMVETFLTYPKRLNLLLYQAGADPHVDDPLGGWLTTEELKYRDRVLFAQCRRYRVPVVWNLAGGYQEPIDKVLELHTNTMVECLNVKQRGEFALGR